MIAALYIATVIFYLAFGAQLVRLGVGMTRTNEGPSKKLAVLHLATGSLLCILPIGGLAFELSLRTIWELGVAVAAINFIGRQFINRSSSAAP